MTSAMAVSCRLLVEAKAKIDMETATGNRPLFEAARLGHYEVVYLLVEAWVAHGGSRRL